MQDYMDDDDDDSGPVMVEKHPSPAPVRKLNLVSALLGNCLCEPFQQFDLRGFSSAATQFVELHGIQFIGLGAVIDELTPRERVYDTLEQLTTRSDRLVSVGYLLERESTSSSVTGTIPKSPRKKVETIPLDVWNKNFPNDKSMSRDVRRLIDQVRNNDLDLLAQELSKRLSGQKAFPSRGNNKFLAGITAHNLGVLMVLLGRDRDAAPMFQQAVALKEAAFGAKHPEVALSWSELGIQQFARGDFEGALSSFREAQKKLPSTSQARASMILNNIACCNFQMGNSDEALKALEEARALQQTSVGAMAQADLDLLHVAVVICNCGYLNLALKRYEEARVLLEEALLIQQSVLGDSHRAIRDTLSNLDFTNAFHS